MTINLINDMSVLTDVSENTLKKFLPVSNFIVGNAVYEAMCEKRDLISVDIGMGQIDIKLDDDAIHYRFIPSKELEQVLIKTLTSHASPMTVQLENKLQGKIDRAYKELL